MSYSAPNYSEATTRDEQGPWSEFLGENLNSIPEKFWTVVPALTPFVGTQAFRNLSHFEADRIFWFFVMFQAEAFLHLERLLMSAFRRLRNDERFAGEDETIRQFLREEAVHAKGFRKFLRQCPKFRWPDESLFMGRFPLLSKFMHAIVQWRPWCLLMPGLKLEIYSVCYGEYLMRNSSQIMHPWRRLHYLHLIDETAHVKSDLRLLELGWQRSSAVSKIYDAVAALILTVLLNLMLVICCYSMLRQSSFSRTMYKSARMVPMLFRWIYREFPPYINTRKKLRHYFSSNAFPLRKVFAFMYW